MTREAIIDAIRRTAKANGDAPLGWRRFEEETGIGYYDWYGQYWSRWGDAVREAGFEPNQMTEAFDQGFLVEKLVELTQSLGRVPTQGDLLLARRADSSFPSEKVFRRLGHKPQRASLVVEVCDASSGLDEVAALWRPIAESANQPNDSSTGSSPKMVGYVYLLKHGSRREYKIGRTEDPVRREGEIGIQLPEKVEPIHYIETDDPAGVEAYWHRRFASKRKQGEWFGLSADDVKAFKRWKKIY